MNCPKCGYVQEDQIECVRCGVVFTKYYAMHSPMRAADTDADARGTQVVLDAEAAVEFGELRQGVRDLTRRVNELDFEKAERTRMRADLRTYERRTSEELEGLRKLVQEVKDRTPLRAEAAGPDPRVLDLVRKFDTRLTQLEARIPACADPTADAGDERIDRLTRELEVVRAELRETCARFGDSETHAISAAALRELAGGLTALQESESGYRRDLDVVTAVCAGLRDQMVNLAGVPVACESLTEDIEKVSDHVGRLGEELAALADRAGSIEHRLTAAFARVDALRLEADRTSERLTALEETARLPASIPLDAEVHAIREHLDHIRAFFGALAEKL